MTATPHDAGFGRIGPGPPQLAGLRIAKTQFISTTVVDRIHRFEMAGVHFDIGIGLLQETVWIGFSPSGYIRKLKWDGIKTGDDDNVPQRQQVLAEVFEAVSDDKVRNTTVFLPTGRSMLTSGLLHCFLVDVCAAFGSLLQLWKDLVKRFPKLPQHRQP